MLTPLRVIPLWKGHCTECRKWDYYMYMYYGTYSHFKDFHVQFECCITWIDWLCHNTLPYASSYTITSSMHTCASAVPPVYLEQFVRTTSSSPQTYRRMSSLSNLPEDLILDELLPILPVRSVLSLGATNHQFHKLSGDEALWKLKCLTDFNFSGSQTSRRSGWKFIYKGLSNPKVFVWGYVVEALRFLPVVVNLNWLYLEQAMRVVED